MSAIAALLGGLNTPNSTSVEQVTRILEACRRGSDDVETHATSHGALGVSRFAWESATYLSAHAGCVDRDGVVVVADATLYYDADLRAALQGAGVQPGSVSDRFATATHRILEAYRAWGADAPAHLEGDFAFIVWDGARRQLVAARSFSAKRPLYFWEKDGSIVLASTVGGLLGSRHVRAPLRMEVVGLQAAGLTVDESETPFEGVRSLAPGETLLWMPGQTARVVRHWDPAGSEDYERLSFDDAAVELRRILVAATGERLAGRGPSAVWMSGGRDSTAVFAAGQSHIRGSRWRKLRPVSWSYPEGDPGRENDWISATARQWGETPVWLDPYSVAVLDAEEMAHAPAPRDEPFVHLFEKWNRSLARASWESAECRVALDGNGGDQLFSATPHALSDYLVRGRWGELRRQWAELSADYGALGAGAFLQTVVRPAIPRWALAPLGALRGRAYGYVAQRHVPAWIGGEFAAKGELVARQRDREWSDYYAGPGRVGVGEMRFYFLNGEVSRHNALLSALALREGVELRSPLSDGRLVRFAFSRPLSERLDGADGKRLLRAAMRGLLPESVLARRASRTGTTRAYFVRSLIDQAPAVLRMLGNHFALADAGIIEVARFRKEWDSLFSRGEHPQAVQLYRTLQAELWLRERVGYPRSRREDGTASATRYPSPSSSVLVTNKSSRTESIGRDGVGWFPARGDSKRDAGILAS